MRNDSIPCLSGSYERSNVMGTPVVKSESQGLGSYVKRGNSRLAQSRFSGVSFVWYARTLSIRTNIRSAPITHLAVEDMAFSSHQIYVIRVDSASAAAIAE